LSASSRRHVAGALSVAKERASTRSRGEDAQFSSGDAGATVVVRMQGEHNAVAAIHVTKEPFDGVGVEIGRVHLDRRGRFRINGRSRVGSITAMTRCRLERVVKLGTGETLGRVLVEDSVDGDIDSRVRQNAAASVAIFWMPALSRPKTTRRCRVETEL